MESAAVHLPQINAITDVLNTREWLEALRHDQEVSFAAEKSIVADTEDLEILQERVTELQNELFKVNANESTKELVLKRIQFGQVLSDKMFNAPLPSTDSDESSVSACPHGRKAYESLLQDQSKLSGEILQKQEMVDELQKELDAIRKRNFELKKRNRQLMGIISQRHKELEETADQVKSNAACQELKEELESTASRVEIAKCTLQALIVGSGVNWVHDPDLFETVLLCGEPLQL